MGDKRFGKTRSLGAANEESNKRSSASGSAKMFQAEVTVANSVVDFCQRHFDQCRCCCQPTSSQTTPACFSSLSDCGLCGSMYADSLVEQHVHCKEQCDNTSVPINTTGYDNRKASPPWFYDRDSYQGVYRDRLQRFVLTKSKHITKTNGWYWDNRISYRYIMSNFLTLCNTLSLLVCNWTSSSYDKLKAVRSKDSELARRKKRRPKITDAPSQQCRRPRRPASKFRLQWILLFLIIALLAAFGAAAPLPAVALTTRHDFVKPPLEPSRNDFTNERMKYEKHYGSRRKRHTITGSVNNLINAESTTTVASTTNEAQITTTKATTNLADYDKNVSPTVTKSVRNQSTLSNTNSITVASTNNTVQNQNFTALSNLSDKIKSNDQSDKNDKSNENENKKQSNNDNNNDNNNDGDFVEFRRWVALNFGDFKTLTDGRTGELLEIDANRTHRIRLRCRALPRSNGMPPLVAVGWRRIGDDVTLAESLDGRSDIELELNATKILKNEDYHCVAIFQSFNECKEVTTTPTTTKTSATKKSEGKVETENEEDDDDDRNETPHPLVVSSRAVKLRLRPNLTIIATPSSQSAQSGSVASLACELENGYLVADGPDDTADVWQWYRNGTEQPLQNGDDEGAIRIYSTPTESKLHILRVDSDAHAGDYRCRHSRLKIEASLKLDVDLKSDDSTLQPPAEFKRVELRADSQQLLECLQAGAVRVRWLCAANESEINTQLKHDAADALATMAAEEGTVLRVSVHQIAAAAGNGGDGAAVADFACIPIDSHGRRLTIRKFTVIVRDDLFHEEDTFTTVHRRIGTPAKFECPTYRGERVAAIGWFRDGRKFVGHPRAKITSLFKPDYNDTQLILSVVEPEDEGFYECVVTAADGGERRRRIRLHVNAPADGVGRPTRLRADVDHARACMRVSFRVPRAAGPPAAAARATFFLAYYPADGSAPLNNVPFNGADCKSIGAVTDAPTAATSKILIDGKVVDASDFLPLILDRGDDGAAPVDCALTACADHADHNLEAGVVYTIRVSMVLSSKRLAITRLSPPLTVLAWDAYASRALPLDILYSAVDSQLILRWESPPTDEIRGQVTGFELDWADDRLEGRAAWKFQKLNASTREYHIPIGNAKNNTPFSYRVRVVPLTRAGAPPKPHMQSASNFAFVVAGAALFTDSSSYMPADAPAPLAFAARQCAPGAACLRINWDTSENVTNCSVIVRYAEAPRHSQQRGKPARLAHLYTRTIPLADEALELQDGLKVGSIYQICAAFEVADKPTRRRSFWRCIRVPLVDVTGQLAHVSVRSPPSAIRCNDDKCRCEYLPASDTLRIYWGGFANATNSTIIESDASKAAFYVLHYKNDDSSPKSDTDETVVALEVVDVLPPIDSSKNCTLRAAARANFLDLPLACAPAKLQPAGVYRIAIEPQNSERIGTAGDFFTCRLPDDGVAWPPPREFRAAVVGALDGGSRRVAFAWLPLDSRLDGYTIFVRVENGSSAQSRQNSTASVADLVQGDLDVKKYFVPGAHSDRFEISLDDLHPNSTQLAVWIMARPSDNGYRAVASAPLAVDLSMAHLSPAAFGAPAFWRRRAFLAATAATLFVILLIVCIASACILARVRLMEKREKLNFYEENAELEENNISEPILNNFQREFFGAADYSPLVHPAKKTTVSWLARFRRAPEAKSKNLKRLNDALDGVSLSSSPLVPRRPASQKLSESSVRLEDQDDLNDLDEIVLLNDQPDHFAVLPEARTVPFDSKGGVNGCEPAGSRRFRQRLQEDAEFRQACLVAARHRNSAATTSALSHLSRWHQSRRTVSCDIKRQSYVVPLIVRVNRNEQSTVVIEMADLLAKIETFDSVPTNQKNNFTPMQSAITIEKTPIDLKNKITTAPDTITNENNLIIFNAKENKSPNNATVFPAKMTEKHTEDDLSNEPLTVAAAETFGNITAPQLVGEALANVAIDALAERLAADVFKAVEDVANRIDDDRFTRNTSARSALEDHTTEKLQRSRDAVVVDPPAGPKAEFLSTVNVDAPTTVMDCDLPNQNGVKNSVNIKNGPTTAKSGLFKSMDGIHADNNINNSISSCKNNQNNFYHSNNYHNDNNNVNGHKSRTTVKCNGQAAYAYNSNNNSHHKNNRKNNNNTRRHQNNKYRNHNFHKVNSASGCAPPAATAGEP